MKLRNAVLFALVLMSCAAQTSALGAAQGGAPGAAQPSAPGAGESECISRLSENAKRARAHINLYLGELKAMSDNPWARNSASVCNSALSRADQYYKKQSADNALCTGGSSYVDNQTAQLYKTAISTCRSQFNGLLSKLPADEQRELSESIAKKEAGLR